MRKLISIMLVVASLLGCMTFSACGDDYTAHDLQAAKQRYFSGSASKSDKTMVEGFYKWKAEQ